MAPAIGYLAGDFYGRFIDFTSQALKPLHSRDPAGAQDAENGLKKRQGGKKSSCGVPHPMCKRMGRQLCPTVGQRARLLAYPFHSLWSSSAPAAVLRAAGELRAKQEPLIS